MKRNKYVISQAATHPSGRMLLCIVCALASGLFAADDFMIHVYPAPKASPAPIIDGNLDDPSWKNAPVVSGFTPYGKDAWSEVQTSFRVLWDNNNLYFGIHCDEPRASTLNPIVYPVDSMGIFGDEVIELFIDPAHSHDLYYQIAVSAAGSIFDGCRTETYWSSDAIAKTRRGTNFWTLEIAIPWRSMGASPVAGRVVGFNVCRDRHLDGKSWMNWSRTMTGFHDPVRFAHLVLSGKPENIGRLSAEFRIGDRNGPIVVHTDGFSKATYDELAAVSFKELSTLTDELTRVQASEQDAAAIAEARVRIGTFAKEIAGLKSRVDGMKSAADWIRISIDMQRTIAALKKSIGEVKLAALLGGI